MLECCQKLSWWKCTCRFSSFLFLHAVVLTAQPMKMYVTFYQYSRYKTESKRKIFYGVIVGAIAAGTTQSNLSHYCKLHTIDGHTQKNIASSPTKCFYPHPEPEVDNLNVPPLAILYVSTSTQSTCSKWKKETDEIYFW